MSVQHDEAGPVTRLLTPIRLEYRYNPGEAQTRFLRALKEGRVIGLRCSQCRKVYTPPRGACSMCGAPFAEEVEISSKGTLVTYAVVNVNFASRSIELPYVSAEVLFDGSDTTTSLLLQDFHEGEVRLGMRVQARWKPQEEWEMSLTNIECVVPIDEPDADYETFKEHG